MVRHYANEVSGSSIGSDELANHPLFIFVDGVDWADEARMLQLKELMSSSPNARWMLLATMRPGDTLNTYTKQYGLEGMHALTVSTLPRTAIRLLSARWMKQETDGPTTDGMFQNVMEHIRRTGLPRTGYVVSLMLWTLRNTSSGELLNEAVLLGNILDYLLNRMDYRGSLRSEFDFQSKSIVLQHLAHWMKNSESFQDKNDVVAELIRYLGEKGLRYDAAAIIEGFIKCGVFSQLDEQVGFRYQRFQEYFVAGHLRDDRDAYQVATSDDNWRFYRRELDIYTSRFRNETELLDIAKAIIDKIVRPQSELRGAALEQYMQDGSNSLIAMRRLEEMRSKPLTAAQIDLIKDKAEARWRDRRDRRLELASPEQIAMNDFPIVKFGDALELYSQFIRNLEFADREEKRRHLAACMEGWVEVMTGVYNGLRVLFGELRADFNGSVAERANGTKQIHQMLDDFESQGRCLIPSIISRTAHHNLGSEKLFDFIDEIAADAERDKFARLAQSTASCTVGTCFPPIRSRCSH